MLSYKDKLLFLSFKKILTVYLHLMETELNDEANSLKSYRNSVPITLSPSEQKYVCNIYDEMLLQNNQFKQLITSMAYEISYFYSTYDFSFSPISIDFSNDLSIIYLKKIASLITSS